MKYNLCCFTVNTTHACSIANNYICKNLDNIKVIYINEKREFKKIKEIISKFYSSIEEKLYYSEWLNEDIINDYDNEEFVFVVHGNEKFIENVNKFLSINEFNGYVINCYDIYEIKSNIEEIIKKHDYYINTTSVSNANIKLDNNMKKTS